MMEQLELFPELAANKTPPETPAATAHAEHKLAHEQGRTVWEDLADAAARGAEIVAIDSEEDFDPNDRRFFTPDDPKYIEAERLPPEWLALVGTSIYADRQSVGTLADVLEVLSAQDADEWRGLMEAADRDGLRSEAQKRLDEFEERSGIVWDAYGFSLVNPDTGEVIVGE